MNARAFCLLLAAVLGLTGTPRASAAEPGPAPLGFPGYQTVALSRGMLNHLLMDARISGRKALLAVDTGAPFSVLDLGSSGKFGLGGPDPNSGIPATMTINGLPAETAILRDLEAGGMHFGSGPIAIVDLSSIKQRRRDRRSMWALDGIVGVDILRTYGGILDCRAPAILFRTGDTRINLAGTLAAAGYVRIPMTMSSERLFTVPCSLNAKPFRMVVDTGASATTIDPSIATRLGLRAVLTKDVAGGVNTGDSRVSAAQAENLHIGGFAVAPLTLAVVRVPQIPVGSEEGGRPLGGLIGNEILAQHHGIIDIDGLALYLRQSEAAPAPLPTNRRRHR